MQSGLNLKNNLAELSHLYAFVEEYGHREGLSKKLIHNLTLCLEEVFSNVVQYAFNDDAEHDIWISLSSDKACIEIQIEDDGKPFNPLNVPLPGAKSFDDLDIGGLGLHLVRCLSNRLSYQRTNGKNVLTLTFNQPNGCTT